MPALLTPVEAKLALRALVTAGVRSMVDMMQ